MGFYIDCFYGKASLNKYESIVCDGLFSLFFFFFFFFFFFSSSFFVSICDGPYLVLTIISLLSFSHLAWNSFFMEGYTFFFFFMEGYGRLYLFQSFGV
jgi:hypothetical protein